MTYDIETLLVRGEFSTPAPMRVDTYLARARLFSALAQAFKDLGQQHCAPRVADELDCLQLRLLALAEDELEEYQDEIELAKGGEL